MQPTQPAASSPGRPLPEPTAWRLERWCQKHWLDARLAGDRRAALATSLGLYGLRCGEVAAARVGHVRHGLLYIRTLKHGRPRELPIDEGLLDALAASPPLPRSINSPLLRTRTGRAFTAGNVSHLAARAAAAIGELFTFHSLRHTAAMRLYAATGDVYAVMHMLGHSSLRHTAAYIRRHTPADTRGFPEWSADLTRPRRLAIHRAPPATAPHVPWWEQLYATKTRAELQREHTPSDGGE